MIFVNYTSIKLEKIENKLRGANFCFLIFGTIGKKIPWAILTLFNYNFNQCDGRKQNQKFLSYFLLVYVNSTRNIAHLEQVHSLYYIPIIPSLLPSFFKQYVDGFIMLSSCILFNSQ
jgi:ABC-type amino acid transport system permease subunit